MTEAVVRRAAEKAFAKVGHFLEYKPGIIFQQEQAGLVMHLYDPDDKSASPYRLRVRFANSGTIAQIERMQRGRVGAKEMTRLLYFVSEICKLLKLTRINAKLMVTQAGMKLARGLGIKNTAQIRTGLTPTDLQLRIKKYWKQHWLIKIS